MKPIIKTLAIGLLLSILPFATGAQAATNSALVFTCSQTFSATPAKIVKLVAKAAAVSPTARYFAEREQFQNLVYELRRLYQKQPADNLEKWITWELKNGEVFSSERRDDSINVTVSYDLVLKSGIKAIFKESEGKEDIYAPWVNPRHEVAAYELSKYINFDLVPVTAIRDVTLNKGQVLRGSVQAFVEKPLKGYKEGPYLENWKASLRLIRIFDYLTHNWDRHSGNYLKSELVLAAIDHGAAFQLEGSEKGRFIPLPLKQLPADSRSTYFMWSLAKVTDQELADVLSPNLSQRQIDELLARRHKLIAQYRRNVQNNVTVPDYEIEERAQPMAPKAIENPFLDPNVNPFLIFNPWFRR